MKDSQQLLIPKRAFKEAEMVFQHFDSHKFGNEAYLKKAKGNLGLK